MKVYTRGGDDGETSLFGGDRVRKSAPRVEAYGEVDEWVPPADGIPEPGRIGRFLSLRENLGEPREQLLENLANFPPADVLADDTKPLKKVGSVLASKR